MKKRILSLFFVFIFVFTGAFSCIASAASRSIGQRLFDFYFDHIFLSPDIDFWGIADKPRDTARDFLRDFLFDQGETESENDGNYDLDSSLYGTGRLNNVSYFNSGLIGSSLTNSVGILPGKALKCTIDPHSQFSIFPNCSEFYAYDLQFYYSDQSRHREWGCYNSAATTPYIRTNTSDSPMFLYVRYDVISNDDPIDLSSVKVDISGGFHWGWDTDIYFQSLFTKNDLGDLDINLTASRDLMPTIDGTCKITCGILYDFDGDITYAADFVKGGNYTSGHEWKWSFDLGAFSYYLYRKRLGTENFYSFVSVYSLKDNKFLYFNKSSLIVDPPGGIFDDIEDPPEWKDYEPDPSIDPTPPSFDPDKIFNYSPVTNTYQSFSWTTINNYNVSGSGGNSGAGGGDSSSGSGDDSSSGTDDPGGDSSSGSDSGGDGSFNDWFSDAVVTINNNVNGGLDTLNENIRIIKENTENYFDAVHDYIEGYFHDWLEYIAALLKNFRDDFNDWTSAFSDYLSDTFNTVNHNIVIVGDNIVKAIKTQVVPDKDVLYDIASTNFPVVDQINSSFSDFEVENKSLIVSIPLFGSDSEPSAVFVNQSLKSSGQLRGGDDNSNNSVSLPINDVSGDCLTFNLTEIFTQYDIPRFRSVGTLFILGSTLWSLINITFKIFGLGFFGDVQSSGRKME